VVAGIVGRWVEVGDKFVLDFQERNSKGKFIEGQSSVGGNNRSAWRVQPHAYSGMDSKSSALIYLFARRTRYLHRQMLDDPCNIFCQSL
jgi:hypothetical protein